MTDTVWFERFCLAILGMVFGWSIASGWWIWALIVFAYIVNGVLAPYSVKVRRVSSRGWIRKPRVRTEAHVLVILIGGFAIYARNLDWPRPVT